MYLIIGLLLVLWLLGLLGKIGSGFIHILLVIALVLLIYRLLTNRNPV